MSEAEQFRPHYTVDDYRAWQGHWELLEGTAVAMTPSPFGPHERFISRINYQFQQQIEEQQCDCMVYTNLDWIVTDDTVVRPDLMMVCGQQPETHLQRPPSLIVEALSPTTERVDRVFKRRLYLEQGVEIYILGDAATNSLEVQRLADNDYVVLTESQFNLGDACRFCLDASRLFDSRQTP